MDDTEVRARVAALEHLLGQVEALADSQAREHATAAVRALAELYGEALARILRHATATGATRLLAAARQDELVSHLLLLHDLHPAPEVSPTKVEPEHASPSAPLGAQRVPLPVLPNGSAAQ